MTILHHLIDFMSYPLFLGLGGGSPPPAPASVPTDLAAAQTAAGQGVSTANTNLGFTQGLYNSLQPYVSNLQSAAGGVNTMAGNVANSAYGMMGNLNNTYNNTFAPITTQAAMSSLGSYYLNPDQQQQLQGALSSGNTSQVNSLTNTAVNNSANQAMGLAQASNSNASAQQARNLSRMGGDPNRMAAFSAELANQQAANAAGAANTARFGTINQMTALQAGMSGLGLGYAGTGLQAGASATGAGLSGVSALGSGLSAPLSSASMVNSAYGNLQNAYGNTANVNIGAAGTATNNYNAQVNAYNAQQQYQAQGLAGLGQLGMAAVMAHHMNML